MISSNRRGGRRQAIGRGDQASRGAVQAHARHWALVSFSTNRNYEMGREKGIGDGRLDVLLLLPELSLKCDLTSLRLSSSLGYRRRASIATAKSHRHTRYNSSPQPDHFLSER
jgi:hypothetical protein